MQEIIIFPEQFFDHVHSLSGEKRLLMAMLEDALHQEEVYRKIVGIGGRRSRRLYDELRHWFLSTESCWGSFQYICEVVGLDHDAAVDTMRKRFNSVSVRPSHTQSNTYRRMTG